MPEDLVEGWTEPVDQELLADKIPIDGTGLTLELELYDRTGVLVDTTTKVSWLDQAGGQARFLPGSTDLTVAKSPYEARWKVTAGGRSGFYPNGPADVWTVRR